VTKPYTFDAPLWEWGARASWFFVTVPLDIAEEISVRYGANAAGFGSIKVEAVIGSSKWETSIFPSDRDPGAYVLPIKKAVRVAEGLDVDVTATVELRVTAPR
jgi:hypothetical protein